MRWRGWEGAEARGTADWTLRSMQHVTEQGTGFRSRVRYFAAYPGHMHLLKHFATLICSCGRDYGQVCRELAPNTDRIRRFQAEQNAVPRPSRVMHGAGKGQEKSTIPNKLSILLVNAGRMQVADKKRVRRCKGSARARAPATESRPTATPGNPVILDIINYMNEILVIVRFENGTAVPRRQRKQ